MGAGPDVVMDAEEVVGAIIRHHTRHNLNTIEIAYGHAGDYLVHPRRLRNMAFTGRGRSLADWMTSDRADRMMDDGYALIAHMPWPTDMHDMVTHLMDEADRVVLTWQRGSGRPYWITEWGGTRDLIVTHAVWQGRSGPGINIEVWDKPTDAGEPATPGKDREGGLEP